jgi:hypothetical protein
MARKRLDSKKWQSRQSRRKLANRNKKPCKLRKNNSKPSRPTKPSRQKRKKIDIKKKSSIPLFSLETQLTEEVFDARMTHNFLSER